MSEVGIQELVVNRHHIVYIQVLHVRRGVAYKGRGDADYKE